MGMILSHRKDENMANGNTHRAVAALVVGGSYLKQTGDKDSASKAVLFGSLASILTNAPDLIEPAIHSHHRQFFHSIAVAGLIGMAGKQAYEWNPEEDWQKAFREFLLIGCGAYLIHLALDACSSRSLPLLGKM